MAGALHLRSQDALANGADLDRAIESAQQRSDDTSGKTIRPRSGLKRVTFCPLSSVFACFLFFPSGGRLCAHLAPKVKQIKQRAPPLVQARVDPGRFGAGASLREDLPLPIGWQPPFAFACPLSLCVWRAPLANLILPTEHITSIHRRRTSLHAYIHTHIHSPWALYLPPTKSGIDLGATKAATRFSLLFPSSLFADVTQLCCNNPSTLLLRLLFASTKSAKITQI